MTKPLPEIKIHSQATVRELHGLTKDKQVSSFLNLTLRPLGPNLRPVPNCVSYGMFLQLKSIVKWRKNHYLRLYSVQQEKNRNSFSIQLII
jgi:hypothetical protein